MQLKEPRVALGRDASRIMALQSQLRNGALIIIVCGCVTTQWRDLSGAKAALAPNQALRAHPE